MTVNKALSNLALEGYIERAPGKGSFVSSSHIRKNVGCLRSFTEDMGCRVTPMYPTQFSRDERFYGENALVVGVSQGGQSLSTVEGLDAANAGGIITTALSANPAALVFEHSAAKTMLEVGNERCGAKTKGYGGSILTLMSAWASL